MPPGPCSAHLADPPPKSIRSERSRTPRKARMRCPECSRGVSSRGRDRFSRSASTGGPGLSEGELAGQDEAIKTRAEGPAVATVEGLRIGVDTSELDPRFRHSYSRDQAILIRRLRRIEGQARGIERMI